MVEVDVLADLDDLVTDVVVVVAFTGFCFLLFFFFVFFFNYIFVGVTGDVVVVVCLFFS